MLLSEIKEEDLNPFLINKILFDIPEDDGKTGDCIWVFGSSKDSEERVELAVKLYQEGRAPYIFITGGLGKNGTIPEASMMKEKALSLGIPEDKIFTEEESRNTTENILCSLLILERKFLLQNIHRLIVVSSPFHIQRLRLTLSRYMPHWIEYSYCYSKESPTSMNHWRDQETTIERIYHEAKGILYYAKHQYIDDKKISE